MPAHRFVCKCSILRTKIMNVIRYLSEHMVDAEWYYHITAINSNCV